MAGDGVGASIVLALEADGTPGVDWVVARAAFTERVSAPYELVLQLETDATDAEPVQLLGKPCKLVITRGDMQRQVPGIVAAVGELGHVRRVEVVVRPALEALRHRVDTRIFQEKTVPEILAEVLGAALGDYDRSVDDRTSRPYRPCDYRVQFRESDLDFCHRLMEEEGISYFFELDGDAEVMVLCDDPSELGEVQTEHEGPIPFGPTTGTTEHEQLGTFTVTSQIRPTKLTMRHYDWRAPSAPLENESTDGPEGDVPSGAMVGPEREVYEHDLRPLTLEPGGLTYGADDAAQAQVRRERDARDARVADGTSNVLGMRHGAKLEIAGHPRSDLDGAYLALEVSHQFLEDRYENRFRALPDGVPLRPV
ncbi:MAG: type VI secretion system tip protein TssI/VgrG, partial [Sandaracinaceae bacterium]